MHSYDWENTPTSLKAIFIFLYSLLLLLSVGLGVWATTHLFSNYNDLLNSSECKLNNHCPNKLEFVIYCFLVPGFSVWYFSKFTNDELKKNLRSEVDKDTGESFYNPDVKLPGDSFFFSFPSWAFIFNFLTALITLVILSALPYINSTFTKH